jgi:hypothetical protein
MADTIPTDLFSKRRRELADDPGARRAGSTIQVQDFYGNHEAWIVETFRQDGKETVFLIVSGAEDGRRIMLPPAVTEKIYGQRETLVAASRRAGARQAVETKRAKGKPIGNPAALAKARKARRR